MSERAGCKNSQLVLRASDIDWAPLGDIRTIGITAGASAPEVLVEEIIDAFAERYDDRGRDGRDRDRDMFFPLPRELRETEPPSLGRTLRTRQPSEASRRPDARR